jgi:hypothetical protein
MPLVGLRGGFFRELEGCLEVCNGVWDCAVAVLCALSFEGPEVEDEAGPEAVVVLVCMRYSSHVCD